MRNSISLIHDTKKKKEELKIPKTPNALCFRGTCVCAPLLRHLRNSFAHACIEREGGIIMSSILMRILKVKFVGK